jgi:hypothetical protein
MAFLQEGIARGVALRLDARNRETRAAERGVETGRRIAPAGASGDDEIAGFLRAGVEVS